MDNSFMGDAGFFTEMAEAEKSASGWVRGPVRTASIGRYSVVSKLGQGASSEVYLCYDSTAERSVAIKRVHPEILRDPARARFYQHLIRAEAALIGRLEHPHVVRIYDAVLEPAEAYIVMEYVHGPTLEDFCGRDRRLSVEEVIEIAFKCTRALAYAQRCGVTHRDIKPANILIEGRTNIKISDFGAALDTSVDTTQINGIGSPAYMSPEQVRDEPLDLRTDIYSLGVVMYQLLTSALPFEATTSYEMMKQITEFELPPPSTRRSDLPLIVEKIVRRATRRHRDRRYQTWEEFSYDLTEALRGDQASYHKNEFDDAAKFEALRGMSFFREFSDTEIWQVLGLLSWERVPGGSDVMREGEPGDFLCVLVEGAMRVTSGGRLLNELKPGACFGEMAYLSWTDKRRHASVSASADSHIARIRIVDLEQAPPSCRHKFDRAFMADLVERLSSANRRLMRVA